MARALQWMDMLQGTSSPGDAGGTGEPAVPRTLDQRLDVMRISLLGTIARPAEVQTRSVTPRSTGPGGSNASVPASSTPRQRVSQVVISVRPLDPFDREHRLVVFAGDPEVAREVAMGAPPTGTEIMAMGRHPIPPEQEEFLGDISSDLGLAVATSNGGYAMIGPIGVETDSSANGFRALAVEVARHS